MATGGEGFTPMEVSKDLDQFLKERRTPNKKVETIVSKSHERAQVERKHSADADDLSRREKEKRLNRFLQKQNRRRRNRRLTVGDVRTEAAKILEEFLQSQLLEQSVQTSPHGAGSRYQRYMEMDIAEERTQTGSGESTGYFASHSTLEREESIPFADDSEDEHKLRTAGSLPHDDMLITMYANRSKPGVEIIHGKSKSVPYKRLDESSLPPPRSNLKPSGMRPPPPPPPGTPFSPSDASGSKESLGYVPYTGLVDSATHGSSDLSDWREGQGHIESGSKQQMYPNKPSSGNNRSLSSNNSVNNTSKHTESTLPTSPKVPTSLELPSKHSRSGSTTPRSESGSKSSSPTKPAHHGSPSKHFGARSKTVIKSGSISSSDSSDNEGGPNLKDRKKKPFYKKAQERLHLLLRKQKDHSPDREDDFSSKEKVPKKRPKKKQKKSKKLDEADSFDQPGRKSAVLEDRYIHINKHVHQTHTGADGGTVYRVEDSTEVMDIVSDSEKKHIEKHMKVKESAEGGKGFLGRIRRMTSREKPKKRVKGSKSSEFHERGGNNQLDVQYGRGLSVPGHTMEDDDDIHITHVERANDGAGHSTVKARQVVDRTNDMRRHSSHLDIVDHDGSLVERVFFNEEEENALPRNKSFDLEEDICVHETEVIENGRVKVIRDVNRHDHMVITDDEFETNGATADQASGNTADASNMTEKEEEELYDTSNMTEKEKEELYGKIAGRLAMIGDNIMLERGDTFSHPASPQQKSSPSPDEEMKRAHLTQLEAEIRDELRLVADEIDARLAANARQAAMRIAGIVAYDQFSEVVDEQVNKEVGWAQVAAVFNITKRAIQVAGASGSLAIQIKEMSLKYIEDKFASWIVGQGGWDSMLSGSETDSDSELD